MPTKIKDFCHLLIMISPDTDEDHTVDELIEEIRPILDKYGCKFRSYGTLESMRMVLNGIHDLIEKYPENDFISYNTNLSCGLCGSTSCRGNCFK